MDDRIVIPPSPQTKEMHCCSYPMCQRVATQSCVCSDVKSIDGIDEEDTVTGKA